ncbi:MAG: Thiamin-phosphate pyrophosphorylase [Myxococcaceae bacterium]|nr:Thiamin-phosphate pyrophosphorylase [Myxococcaceae bacterium]
MRGSALILAALVLGCSGTGGSGGSGGSGASGGSGGGAGGSSGGAGGGSAITAEQACTNLATAFCNKVNSCTPFAIGAFYGDVATCIARMKLTCLPPLGLSNSGASPAKIDACVPMMTSASCAAMRAGTAGCHFTGALAAGAVCGSESQCASGYCKLSSFSCGVCAAKVTNGGNCTASEDCLSGSTCINAVCVAKRALGAACSPTLPCGDLLYCKAGQCSAVVTTAGQACDPNDSDSCDFLSGLFCNSSDVCAQIQAAAPGAACGALVSGYVDCAGGGTCKTNGGLSGTCIAPAADGAACDFNNGVDCRASAACEAGVCKLYNPASCL